MKKQSPHLRNFHSSRRKECRNLISIPLVRKRVKILGEHRESTGTNLTVLEMLSEGVKPLVPFSLIFSTPPPLQLSPSSKKEGPYLHISLFPSKPIKIPIPYYCFTNTLGEVTKHNS